MTRHASLAEQLSALKAFTNRPESIEPINTNWTTLVANDNTEERFDLHAERRVSIRPTWQELMRQAKDGAIERAPDVVSKIFGRTIPGPIVRIGKLRFSDGGQHERCDMAGIDGSPVTGMARMPTGAMLGTKEEQERALGGVGASSGESNAWFCEMFDCTNKQYVPGGKRRKGRAYTRDEAAAMLAEAISNTPVMPEVYYCEDGVALGSARIADNFIGMKKAPKGNGGAIAWQDLSDKIAEREVYLKAEQDLSSADIDVVETVATARRLSDIGGDGHKRNAQKRGRRALLAANENIAAAIKKYTA